jgi:spermidine synthase
MLWSHKLRGFREGFAPGYNRGRNPLDQDLGRYVLGKLDFDIKDQLVSAKTAFQNVDVYDVMYPKTRSMESYQKSLSNDGSFESKFPEQFGPDRILFLDGVIQSTLYGDAPYHESIVHPAMITHPNPKRVAIIGGGEGATLREVLKHNTVEEAAMIEIDEGVVELSREHLPQWQDCSSISHHEQSAEWCFDDTRVKAKFEDAMAYFIDHFSDGADQLEPAYDIIVMDALDPNDDIEFAVELYTSDTYIKSLYNALTEHGILVVQVGEVPSENTPADETGQFVNRAIMREKLEDVGFESIHIYEEAHSGFLAPWSTMLAFKDGATRKNWYRSEAEVELQLHKRILKTEQGTSSLRYFDGATMRQYQLPPRAFEAIHCRQDNTPEECKSEWQPENFIVASSMVTGHMANATTVESSVYNPVVERHGMTSLQSREYSLNNIHGWKNALLNSRA